MLAAASLADGLVTTLPDANSMAGHKDNGDKIPIEIHLVET